VSSSSPGSQFEQGPSPAGMPRWVKISLIVAAVLVVLLVAGMLIGGGQHGPGRHLNSTTGLVAAAVPASTASEAR
jgi:hypothetical protein